MMPILQPETPRLLLRQWQASDYAPFAALNADAQAMEHFPARLSPAESDAMAARLQTLIAERGWGLWEVERKDTGAFIGFVGLHQAPADLPFAPCVEVGWRLSVPHWGQGFASEAARAALRVGFDELGLQEIVALTALGNWRSRTVMQRLGMQESGMFEHPRIPVGSHLRTHCLYRLKNSIKSGGVNCEN